MYKTRYQKVRDDKTKLNKERNECNVKDCLVNPVIEKNLVRNKLKYSNRLSDSQKTELLYYKPQWSYNNSNSTLQSAIENEANGYMKNYFVNDYEIIDKIFHHDGILKQYYVLDDGLYEEYLPIENAHKLEPENFSAILSCNDKYITKKNHVSEPSSPQVSSVEYKSKNMCYLYTAEIEAKDDMIEKYINQSNLPVQLESENKFFKEESDNSESFDINQYYKKINSLLKTTSIEDTTEDSIKSIDEPKYKNVAVQTYPVCIDHNVLQKNHSTQTDTNRHPKKMLRSQLLQNRASQCDDFNIISQSHLTSIKSILKYSQYILLAGVVCNMIRLSCVNKSFPFFRK